jgi:hypothetical protein
VVNGHTLYRPIPNDRIEAIAIAIANTQSFADPRLNTSDHRDEPTVWAPVMMPHVGAGRPGSRRTLSSKPYSSQTVSKLAHSTPSTFMRSNVRRKVVGMLRPP